MNVTLDAWAAVFSLPEKLKAAIKPEFDLYLSVSWQLHCFVYKFKIFIRIKEASSLQLLALDFLFYFLLIVSNDHTSKIWGM